MKAYYGYEDNTFWAIRTNGCECITAEGFWICDFLPERMLDMKKNEEHLPLRPKMKKINFPNPESAEKEAEKMAREKSENTVKQDADFWLEKVKFCGNLLFFVPDEYQTEELCTLANSHKRKYKIGNYLPMGQEMANEGSWREGGTPIYITVLSLIPSPRGWWNQEKDEEIIPSEEEILIHKRKFLKLNFKKLRAFSPMIEIIEGDERINKEIDLLLKNDLEGIGIKLYITIGHKRKAVMSVGIIKKNIIKYFINYGDKGNYRYREKAKEFLDKLMELLNGFCGTIGIDSGPSDILKMDELLIHMGDGKSYGIEDVKWNINYKWLRKN